MCQKRHISLWNVNKSWKIQTFSWGLNKKFSPIKWGFFFLFFLQLSNAPCLPGVGVSSDRCIMFCCCYRRILLASAYYKSLNSRPRLFKKLDTRQSKNPWIINASIFTKMIIETFQEYFSISSLGRKHQASFAMFWFCTNCTKFVWLTSTMKTAYPAVKELLSFFHQNSIWICWHVGEKVASDFQASGLHNCLGKVAQIARKHLSVRWRKSATRNYYGSGVTL